MIRWFKKGCRVRALRGEGRGGDFLSKTLRNWCIFGAWGKV